MKPRILSIARLSFPLATAIASLLTAPAAFAVPITWTGLTTGSWHTNTNWSTSTVPTIADDLTILGPANVAGVLTINLAAATNAFANSLNFTNTAATSVLAVSGFPTLSIGAGGITTGTGLVTIGANTGTGVNVDLVGAQTWNVGAGGLTFSNAVTSGAGETLTKIGSGTLTYNGSGAVAGFAGGLILNNGTMVLDFVNAGTPTNLVASTATLALGGGALTITGKNVAAATTVQTFASTSLGAGVNTINIAKGSLATSATLNLSALTLNSAPVICITSSPGMRRRTVGRSVAPECRMSSSVIT